MIWGHFLHCSLLLSDCSLWQVDIKTSQARPNCAFFPLNSVKCNLYWQNILRILVFHWSLFSIREYMLTYCCLFFQKVTLSNRYHNIKSDSNPNFSLHNGVASVLCFCTLCTCHHNHWVYIYAPTQQWQEDDVSLYLSTTYGSYNFL